MVFLDALASRDPAPGGGAAAAMTAATAAALIAMTARSSSRLVDAAAIAEEADQLRHRAVALVDEDGAGYAEVLAAEPHREDDPVRFHRAVAGANRAPAEVAAVADRVSELGEHLMEAGSRRLRGDVAVGLLLAAAASASAAELIGLNTAYADLGPDDLVLACRQRDACRARADAVVSA